MGSYNVRRTQPSDRNLSLALGSMTHGVTPVELAAAYVPYAIGGVYPTAQRGALDWMGPFHDAIKPVVQKLYESVKSGNEAQISIDSNSQPDYREKLNAELKALRESEMWQTAVTVRQLRPENN